MLGTTGRAVLLLYEGFDVPGAFTNGASLHGTAASGLNLSGTWDASANNFGNYTTVSGGLEDPNGDLVTTPGGLAITRSGSTTAGVPKYARAGIASNAVTGAGQTSLWASALLGVNTAGGAFVSLELDPPTTGSDPGEFVFRLTMGLAGTTAFAATDHNSYNNSATSVTFVNRTNDLLGSYASGETHLFVARLGNKILNSNTVDALQVWVDPDLVLGEAGLGTPDIQITSGNMIFDAGSVLAGNFFQFNFLSTNLNSQSSFLDEFRVGTTFDDVAVIPEPRVVFLVALGLLVAAWRGRGP